MDLEFLQHFLAQTQSWQCFIIDKISYFLEKYASDIFYASVSTLQALQF